MTDNKSSTLQNIVLLLLTFMIAVFAFIEIKKIYWGSLDRNVYFETVSIILLALYFVVILLAFGLALCHFLFHWDFHPEKHARWKNLFFLLLGIFPSVFLQFSRWGLVFSSAFLRILLLSSVLFLMVYVLKEKEVLTFRMHLFFPALIFTTACLLLCSRLRMIVDYPFSLSWSEGNRFWDYSLLFGGERYTIAQGSHVAAFLDLGRQSIWGIVFLCKHLSIAGMRAWNVALYFFPPFTLGFLLFKHKGMRLSTWVFYALWTYAFLSEGPIYAPLIFCAILVFLASKLENYPLSLLLIACAGFIANITRFTWILAPVVWAFLLFYFREKGSGTMRRNLKSYGAALAGLIGGVVLPNFIPLEPSSIILGENASVDILYSIKTILQNQDLLWYRLLPSKTFPLGILPALFLIVAPLFIVVGVYLNKEKVQLEKAEKFYFLASLIGFFLIGCVVSVKVGGGSNLHNMDMFLLTILLVISIFWKNGMAEWFQTEMRKTNLVSLLIFFLLGYPGIRFISSVRPLSLPSSEIVANAVHAIQSTVDDRKEEGDILFIDQRQLLTFGAIQDVELVGEYEKKLLMNEALSNDQAYFDLFYQDLQSRRFALIVAEPLNIEYQSDENNFGEENNAYVKWVSEPLLCYYEVLKTLQEVGVELLVPRSSPLPENINCP